MQHTQQASSQHNNISPTALQHHSRDTSSTASTASPSPPHHHKNAQSVSSFLSAPSSTDVSQPYSPLSAVDLCDQQVTSILEHRGLSVDLVRPGLRIEVLKGRHEGKKGVVRFVGNVHFARGTWIGVELDEPTGRHNGTFRNHCYFKCAQRSGLFLKAGTLQPDPTAQDSQQDDSSACLFDIPDELNEQELAEPGALLLVKTGGVEEAHADSEEPIATTEDGTTTEANHNKADGSVVNSTSEESLIETAVRVAKQQVRAVSSSATDHPSLLSGWPALMESTEARASQKKTPTGMGDGDICAEQEENATDHLVAEPECTLPVSLPPVSASSATSATRTAVHATSKEQDGRRTTEEQTAQSLLSVPPPLVVPSPPTSGVSSPSSVVQPAERTARLQHRLAEIRALRRELEQKEERSQVKSIPIPFSFVIQRVQSLGVETDTRTHEDCVPRG